MSGGEKVVIWAAAILALAGTLTAVRLMHRPKKSISLKGAVIRKDADTKKQLPIADVEITEADGLSLGDCKSDSSGFFSLTLLPGVEPGQAVTLRFRHPEYQPLDIEELVGDKLYVTRLVPVPHEVP